MEYPTESKSPNPFRVQDAADNVVFDSKCDTPLDCHEGPFGIKIYIRADCKHRLNRKQKGLAWETREGVWATSDDVTVRFEHPHSEKALVAYMDDRFLCVATREIVYPPSPQDVLRIFGYMQLGELV